MPARSWGGLAAVLAVVAVVALTLGLRAGAVPGPPGKPTAAKAAPATPLLSARRIGAALGGRVADQQITAALGTYEKTLPTDACVQVLGADGHVIASLNPDQALTPASTQKVLTADAVLAKLGGDTKLRTRFVATAKPDASGTVHGNVWVVGGGDPLLATQAYVQHFFNQPQQRSKVEDLAAALSAAGVKHITGQLLGDDSRYDQLRVVPSWSKRFVAQHQVGPLSALTVDRNVTDWPTSQSEPGFDGTSVSDPPAHAAQVIGRNLTARGITIDGGTGAGTAPPAATELAGLDSLPLHQIVGVMLAESDNQTAELLTKELARSSGQAPTTAAGVPAIRSELSALGLPIQGFGAVDGSGLDDTNHESCRLLASALQAPLPSGSVVDLLAVSGQTGTLSIRFRNTNLVGRLHAKTGSLNGVTGMAGVLTTAKDKTPVTFALLANGPRSDSRLQDKLISVLDTYGATAPDPATLGPR